MPDIRTGSLPAFFSEAQWLLEAPYLFLPFVGPVMSLGSSEFSVQLLLPRLRDTRALRCLFLEASEPPRHIDVVPARHRPCAFGDRRIG